MRKRMKNYRANFLGVFQYLGFYDDEANRAVVLAVAGYDSPETAASELQITEHKAAYLWKYLKKRDALYGCKIYGALLEWSELQDAGA